MARKKSRKPTPFDLELERAEEIPVRGIPTIEENNRRRRRVWRAIVLWPIILPVVVVVLALQMLTMQNAQLVERMDEVQVTSEGRDTAQKALLAWLSADPSPLPGAQVLSWTGASRIDVPAPSGPGASTAVEYRMEINRFTLVTQDGRLWTAGVQVGTSDRLGSKVFGEPSLVPLVAAAEDGSWSGVEIWPGKELIAVPAPVKTAVEAWAKAYTGDDADALRVAVGDTDPDHGYATLPGVHSVTVEVEQQAADVGSQEEGLPPNRLVVRVRLFVAWDSQASLFADEMTAPTLTPITYDLLVLRADTAAPSVVAWDAPGSGPSLKPFANAIIGRDPGSTAAEDEARRQQATEGATSEAETTQEPQAPADETAGD